MKAGEGAAKWMTQEETGVKLVGYETDMPQDSGAGKVCGWGV